LQLLLISSVILVFLFFILNIQIFKFNDLFLIADAQMQNCKDIKYDKTKPNIDLNDPHVNPEMKLQLEKVLKSIPKEGIKFTYKQKDGTMKTAYAFPRIAEVYRPPERSDYLYDRYINWDPDSETKRPGKANPGWGSGHNYGDSLDVGLVDKKGKKIDDTSPIYGNYPALDKDGIAILNAKGNPSMKMPWLNAYKKLVPYFEKQGFDWLDSDAPHFEYHPGKKGAISDKKWRELREAAIKEAKLQGLDTNDKSCEWLKILWYKLIPKSSTPVSENPNLIKPNLDRCDCDNVDCQINCISRLLMELAGN
jgi:hypothetical protein